MAIEHVLVTGGTGFFGKALIRHWVAQHGRGMGIPEVTVLTRSKHAFLSSYPEFGRLPWLRFHEGDILKPETLSSMPGLSHILHAATDSTLGPGLPPIQRYDQIVIGTRHLLDFAVKQGVKRFLLTSSGGIYGPQPPDMDMIPEDYNGAPDLLNPANAYSVAKRAAEHLCALYRDAYGIEPIIARCFAFVGPDLPLNVHFAIGNFIRDAVLGNEIIVKGDGSPVRSYLDQRDLARWLIEMLDRAPAGGVYNVGSDRGISVGDLARLVAKIVAPGLPVRILGRAQPGNFRHRYVPDVSRACHDLGLQASVELNEAIAATAEFARSRGGRS